jgi:hypothetical protein
MSRLAAHRPPADGLGGSSALAASAYYRAHVRRGDRGRQGRLPQVPCSHGRGSHSGNFGGPGGILFACSRASAPSCGADGATTVCARPVAMDAGRVRVLRVGRPRGCRNHPGCPGVSVSYGKSMIRVAFANAQLSTAKGCRRSTHRRGRALDNPYPLPTQIRSGGAAPKSTRHSCAGAS